MGDGDLDIKISGYGEYLGVKEQHFIVYRDGEPHHKFPFHMVKRAIISSGNNVSSTALFWLATYGVETAIVSKTGKLVATIVPAGDDARADTRLKQYEAYFNRKGIEIAQALVEKRVSSEISVMEKHDMNTSKIESRLPVPEFEGEQIKDVRYNILGFEARCTKDYFKQYFKQFPDWLKPSKRIGHKAREPLNNLLNLGYEVLRRRVHVAVIGAHLDPYLGYLHSSRQYQPSLVYDMMEPWRAVVEDFILNYHVKLSKGCFTIHGQRYFLEREPMIGPTKALDKHIDNKRVPYSYRDNSKTVRIRTAIKEDPRKLAQYIRKKKTRARASI